MKRVKKKLASIVCAFFEIASVRKISLLSAVESRTVKINGIGQKPVKSFDDLKNLNSWQVIFFDPSVRFVNLDDDKFDSSKEAFDIISTFVEESFQNILNLACSSDSIFLRKLDSDEFLKSLRVSYNNSVKDLCGIKKTKKLPFFDRYEALVAKSFQEEIDKIVHELLCNYFGYIKCKNKDGEKAHRFLEKMNENLASLPNVFKERLMPVFKDISSNKSINKSMLKNNREIR